MGEFIKVKKKIETAIELLLEKDVLLLKNKVNERSVSHKLAEYIQFLFPSWNVDCEYNRKGLDQKLLDGINACDIQKKTDRVYPDIIIHKRNTNNNYLVIEIKTVRNECCCDIEKLKLFTSSSGVYKYRFGLYLEFKGSESSQRWFNGVVKDPELA